MPPAPGNLHLKQREYDDAGDYPQGIQNEQHRTGDEEEQKTLWHTPTLLVGHRGNGWGPPGAFRLIPAGTTAASAAKHKTLLRPWTMGISMERAQVFPDGARSAATWGAHPAP